MNYYDLMQALMRIEEAASYVGISTQTFRRHVKLGEAPQPIRVGNSLLFREEEITAWALKYRRWERFDKRRARINVLHETHSEESV